MTVVSINYVLLLTPELNKHYLSSFFKQFCLFFFIGHIRKVSPLISVAEHVSHLYEHLLQINVKNKDLLKNTWL